MGARETTPPATHTRGHPPPLEFSSWLPRIRRRSPASSSFVLAAARLRALQLDTEPRDGGRPQRPGRARKTNQPSPAARIKVTGPDPHTHLTAQAPMGAGLGGAEG